MTGTLTSDDEQLIEAARDVIRDAFVHGTHYVGSALRTTSGDVHTGVHVEANVGRASVCAEPVTLGTAVANGVKGRTSTPSSRSATQVRRRTRTRSRSSPRVASAGS